MLVYSLSVSIDGFIADRDGGFGWSVPGDEQFAFHTEAVGELGCCVLGRRLYETMLPWETDPAMRHDAASQAFAEIWSAIPKIVFSRTLNAVLGNARLAEAPLEVELERAMAGTVKDVEVGGAGLAAQAIRLGLVDEIRIFRNPIILGGGTPLLPAVDVAVPLQLVETRTFASRVVYERYRRDTPG